MTSEPLTSQELTDPASPGAIHPRYLTALPVYNERTHVATVLSEVKKYATDILVVDDGSNDGTACALAQCHGIEIVRHPKNLGYGAALQTAFRYALEHRYEVLLTIDCDGQHEPQRIGQLVEACQDLSAYRGSSGHGKEGADIVSGSRYLVVDESAGPPPAARRRINEQITQEINGRLGLQLTDAFCGFKAYRVEALARLHLTETGYAMPLELWVQAAYHGLRIVEQPVPLVYLDEERSFGGALDDASTRLTYYREVIDRAVRACTDYSPATQQGSPATQQGPPATQQGPPTTQQGPPTTPLILGCGPCS
jgi:dolichol-phosphate mannosyltransferase